jgi:hypothetical protein
MPTYYHVSTRELRINTILTQGIYGERIRRHDTVSENYAKYIQEELFELVRQKDYPQRPSRFNCVFLFRDIATATYFYAQVGRYQGYIYEVEVIDDDQFVAEMDLLHCVGANAQTIQKSAEYYWNGEHHLKSATQEVLLNGKAKVLKLVVGPSNIV